MKFNTGKLYQIKQYFWLLYPSKDIAIAAAELYLAAAAVAAGAADYWSIYFNCNVTYISPKDIFCLIEKDGKYLKVLTTNGELGWIKYPQGQEWTKGCIEEVKE